MPLTLAERQWFKARYNSAAVAIVTGSLVEITYVSLRDEYRRPGKRGVVNGFTPGARIRMMKTCARVDWSRVGKSLFITLTYPDRVGIPSMEERQVQRNLFFRYMEKYLGRKVGALWRLEWMTRKSGKRKGQLVPHLHLIVFGVSYLNWVMIRRWWRLVLRFRGPLATDVQGIRAGRTVAKYVTKYCAKPAESGSLDNTTKPNNLGRHWGVHGRGVVPWGRRCMLRCLSPEFIRLAENAACMTFRYFTRDAQQGFSIFGDTGEKLAEIMLERWIDAGIPLW